MSQNPYVKSLETKLYFIVFALFSSFLAIMIYNLSLDVAVADDSAVDEENAAVRHWIKSRQKTDQTINGVKSAPEIKSR